MKRKMIKGNEIATATPRNDTVGKALLLLGMLAWLASSGGGTLQAASTDTIQMLVTPAVNYSVLITSVNAQGYNFGTVDLGAVTRSTAGITVTNNGNVSSKWQLRLSTEGSVWGPAAAGGSAGLDTFVLRALFNASPTGAPGDGDFVSNEDDVLLSYKQSAEASTFDYASNSADMSSIPSSGSNTRYLWMRLAMPTGSSSATQQQFRMWVTAVP